METNRFPIIPPTLPYDPNQPWHKPDPTPVLPDSLRWYEQQVHQARALANTIPVGTAEFRQAVEGIKTAKIQFADALRKQGDALAGFIDEVHEISIKAFPKLVGRGVYSGGRLPRNRKKSFIKKYGRKEYHRRYTGPSFILEITSPGGPIR